MNIEQLLQYEVACARRLIQKLDQEHAALTQRDATALDSIVPEKQSLIAELESLGQKYDAVFAVKSHSASTTKSVNPFNGDKRLSDLWDELKSLAQLCKDKNRINGSMIEIGYRHSVQALDILRGVTAGSELYDKSGRTTKPGSSHRSIRA